LPGNGVLRFWNCQILGETTDVMETIRRTLASSE
jgi:very-short-patch-repair endonuclease